MIEPATFRLISFISVFALLLVSGYTDIMRNKVYNWCTLPGIGVGMALAYLGGGLIDGGGYNLMNSVVGLVAGGGIMLVFSLLGGIGLGDVKLMAAVGALTGFPFVMNSLLYSALVGFVMALGMLIWKGRVKEGLKGSLSMAFRWRAKQPVETADIEVGAPEEGKAETETPPRRPPDTIPFGAAIAFGTLWAFFTAVGTF